MGCLLDLAVPASASVVFRFSLLFFFPLYVQPLLDVGVTVAQILLFNLLQKRHKAEEAYFLQCDNTELADFYASYIRGVHNRRLLQSEWGSPSALHSSGSGIVINETTIRTYAELESSDFYHRFYRAVIFKNPKWPNYVRTYTWRMLASPVEMEPNVAVRALIIANRLYPSRQLASSCQRIFNDSRRLGLLSRVCPPLINNVHPHVLDYLSNAEKAQLRLVSKAARKQVTPHCTIQVQVSRIREAQWLPMNASAHTVRTAFDLPRNARLFVNGWLLRGPDELVSLRRSLVDSRSPVHLMWPFEEEN